jgi:hypothetical protein
LLAGDEVSRNRFVFRRVDAQTGKQEILLDRQKNERVYLPADLSRDGKYLVFWSFDTPADGKWTYPYTAILTRRNLETGEERELYRAKCRGPYDPLLSPDHAQVATGIVLQDGTSVLFAVPIDGGAPREFIRAPMGLSRVDTGSQVGIRCWSSDSRHVLVVRPDSKPGFQQLCSYPIAGGEPVPTGLTFAVIGGLRLSPDGRRIAFIGRQPQTEIWAMRNFLPVPKPSRLSLQRPNSGTGHESHYMGLTSVQDVITVIT